MNRRAVVAALMAAPLAGCERGACVEVRGRLPSPIFTFRHAGLIGTPLAFPGTLEVGEADPPYRRAAWGPDPMWRVSAAAFSTREVPYGRTPYGLSQWMPAEPLRKGVLYAVRVSGDGFIGGTIFGQVGDELITADDCGVNSDEQARERFRRALAQA